MTKRLFNSVTSMVRTATRYDHVYVTRIAQFLAEFNKSHEKEPATKSEVQNVTSTFSNSLEFDLSSMIPQV